MVIVMIVMMLVLSACMKRNSETKPVSGELENSKGQTYNFKLAHIAPPTHIWNDAAIKFAEELEKRSDGRMKMELYPGGQLGGEPDMVQQLETGSLDFAFITTAFLTSKSDAFSAWFAPYLFESYEAAFEAKDTEVA